MTWTQPICAACWDERNPRRRAVALPDGPRERCCYCGKLTSSGIYVRVDPMTVPYPDGTRWTAYDGDIPAGHGDTKLAAERHARARGMNVSRVVLRLRNYPFTHIREEAP